jgi:hypothetical protein
VIISVGGKEAPQSLTEIQAAAKVGRATHIFPMWRFIQSVVAGNTKPT